MSDSEILLAACVLFWLSFTGLFLVSPQRGRLIFLNFIIHVLYSCYMSYGLKYKSQHGSGLVWWFYLLIIVGIHTLVNLILIFVKIFRQVNAEAKTINSRNFNQSNGSQNT